MQWICASASVCFVLIDGQGLSTMYTLYCRTLTHPKPLVLTGHPSMLLSYAWNNKFTYSPLVIPSLSICLCLSQFVSLSLCLSISLPFPEMTLCGLQDVKIQLLSVLSVHPLFCLFLLCLSDTNTNNVPVTAMAWTCTMTLTALLVTMATSSVSQTTTTSATTTSASLLRASMEGRPTAVSD